MSASNLFPRTSKNNRTRYPEHYFKSAGSFLDFGGNRGNLLYFGMKCASEYTCIDVDKGAIEAGKIEFPNSTWIHYDKYSWVYNHGGKKDAEFPTVSPQDYIYAYSVFSHTDLE